MFPVEKRYLFLEFWLWEILNDFFSFNKFKVDQLPVLWSRSRSSAHHLD